MKIVASLILLLVSASASLAQSDSLRWYFTLADVAPRLQSDNQLIISADVPEGWGLYSTNFQQGSIGPAPSSIALESPLGYVALDAVRAIKPIVVNEPGFEVTYSYFVSNAEFRQCIKLVSPHSRIRGTITGQLFHLITGATIDFKKSFDLEINIETTN